MANANPGLPPELQGLPPINAFVKPEQIAAMAHLNNDTKRAYADGLQKIYLALRNDQPTSQAYINNYKKLNEITNVIKQQMRAHQQHTASRPGSQAQTNPPSNGQVPPSVAQNGNTQLQVSPEIMDKARALNLIVPPSIESRGQQAAQTYIKQLRTRYAQDMQRLEQGKSQLQAIENYVLAKQRKGESLTGPEQTSIEQKRQASHNVASKARESLLQLQTHQNEIKRQAQGQAAASGGAAIKEEGQDTNLHVPLLPQQPGQNVTPANHTGQAHTVSSALDAVRSQQTGGSATSPTKPSKQPNNQQATTQPPDMPQQNRPSQMPPATQPTNSNVPSSQPPSSQPQIPTSTASTANPAPLPFPTAMAQSQQLHSNPQSTQPNSSSSAGSSSHAHPQIPSRIDTNPSQGHRMPIAKEMRFEPPQPVNMGPARPTLTGGPTNMNLGSMGAPALSKHPGYVLGVEGERVLSKKKLQELVRQVTGGSGLDGEGEELDPKVEEVRIFALPLIHFSLMSFHLFHSGVYHSCRVYELLLSPSSVYLETLSSHAPLTSQPYPLREAPPRLTHPALFPPADSPRPRRFFRRSSHHRRLPSRQMPLRQRTPPPRHPNRAGAPIQHSSAWLRQR